jgi:hypothetical protein
MQPYATVSDPSPLNGNRAPVINNSNSNNVNKSFFTEYRTQILYSIGVIVAILFLSIVIKKRRSFYDIGKVQIGKKDKKDKKDKKCPKGCTLVIKKVTKNSKKGTTFDPALTNKKPIVKPIRQ